MSVRNLLISLIDIFYFLFKKFMPIHTYRYAVCGGGNLVLDIFLYFIFYNFVFQKENVDLGLFVFSPHIAAFAFVFPITFITGFALNKYITFSSSELRGKVQLFRYFIVTVGAILINYFFIKFFVEVLGLYPTPSKIVTTVIAVIYSFLLQKNFTFKFKG